MFALRQLAAFLADGAESDMSAIPEFVFQLVDVNPRFILRLKDDGRASGDLATATAGGGSFALQLPQNYDPANRLCVLLSSSKTIEVTIVAVSGTYRVMVRAGFAQLGLLAFSDYITSITVLNAGASDALIEWLLYELPDITTVDGWRDGAIALGTSGPTGSTTVAPVPVVPIPAVSYVDSVHWDYLTGPVTSAGWTQIKAATAGKFSLISVFHGNGAPVYLGVGAAGFEQIVLLIPPGGISNQSELTIPAGARLSLKAVTAVSATEGELDLTGFA